MKLSPVQQRFLHLMILRENEGFAHSTVPTRTAEALERRGLITARFSLGYLYSPGMDCWLTDAGRRVARTL